MRAFKVNSDFFSQLQDKIRQKLVKTRKTFGFLTAVYNYNDQKAEAQPLKLHFLLLLPNTWLTRQNDSTQKAVQTRLPLFRLERLVTNSNYIIRKTGTIHTQCVHLIRLISINLNSLEIINSDNLEADPSRRTIKKRIRLV